MVLVCCGLVAAIVYNTAGNPNERTWRLRTNEHQTWTLRFNRGDAVNLKVISDGNSDMDLFVFDDKAKMHQMLNSKLPLEKCVYLCLKYDNGDSKDCDVRFTAPATQDYYLLLVNRLRQDDFRRNGSNSGKLFISPTPR